ncbi:hypothetical protein SDC9_08609 [bioreactor metagenome]|uniref:Transglutaminase-like domain-containing protein n=1 Tax=bioreactor metagenome TaxID=1076179 RepID=A0A644T888_9ZZZZ
MLFAFIILFVIANSSIIYANDTNDTIGNLFTQSADNLSEDSINNVNNSEKDIININKENINNISENQTNNESSTNNPNDSNSEIGETEDNSDYDNNQLNNSNKEISEENNQTGNVSTTYSKNAAGGTVESNTIKILTSTVKFSNKNIMSAATELKKYVEKNGKLPDYITLNGEKISMSEFLYLLSKSIINLNGGSNSDITTKDIKNPSYPNGGSTSGKLYKSNYIDLAKRIVSFVDLNNQAPNYGSSSIGKIQFQTIVYGFAKIVDYYKSNNVMPNYVSFDKKISTNLNKLVPNYNGKNGIIVGGDPNTNSSTNGSNSSSSSGTISLANIKDAGSRIELFVKNNGVLPNYVLINGKQYSMTEFLYLASATIVNINKGINTGIVAKTFKNPSNPSGSSINGNIYKSDFVDLASRVSSYMLKNGQAPNYGSSKLGNIQFQTLVLGFSKILDFTKTEGRLPNYLTLNVKSTDKINGGSGSSGGSGSGSIPTGPLNEKNTLSSSELQKYLVATTNCQVNNAAIKSLATSLTKNCKTELEKATAIFNYVRDNIKYSFYYDTKYSATGTLEKKLGNCVDKTHLLIALSRSAGLAARYVHADCTFTVSGRIGHVFAQIKVGDTWVVADTTSSQNSLGTVKNWNINTYTLKGQGKSASINF